MGDQQSSPYSKGSSSPLGGSCSSTAIHSNIWGHGSGNSGSLNKIFSDNIIINTSPDGTNPTQNYVQIMRCLYTSDYASHRRRVASPAEGTCVWVTKHQKYKAWLKNKSGLLWLSGDPGCGKSVIASFLVHDLSTRPETVVCYFFFKDDNQEQRSAAFALSAILHQLFEKRKPLRRYAQEPFENKGERFAKEVDELWSILVDAVADQVCGDVICVIDGLDECEKETRYLLIRHMVALAGSKTSNIPLKFVVTSRPYFEVEKELGARATIRLKGENEVNAISTDVALLIDKGIEGLESRWKRHGKLEELRILLKSLADRTFLWVSLVLGDLENSRAGSPSALMKLVTTSPATIDELYGKILSKSTDDANARRVLQVVVAATRPLTVQEMNIALTITQDHRSVGGLQDDLYPFFETTVKAWCALFVRIIDSKIYLVHQTAREFLIKGTLPGTGNWQYTLCPVDSNFTLASICITYLSLEDFEDDPLAVDNSGAAVREDIRAYVRKYTLIEYAASHWAGHFRDSCGRQGGLLESTRLICKGGSKRFLTWLKLYWENSDRDRHRPFPNDFTHLMTASWFGQRTVVEKLLREGGDINRRSKEHGTALNIAALWKDRDISSMLLARNASAYLGGEEYNISDTKRNELGERAGRTELARLHQLADELLRLEQGEAIEFIGSIFLDPFSCAQVNMSYIL